MGKSKTPFNLHLNNQRPDVIDRNAIPTCRHFALRQTYKHRVNKYANLTLIESITNIKKTKEVLEVLLKIKEIFWIRTFET